MAKKKVVYLEEPDITIMSLVELGANYTQVEDGKTVLVMKSADKGKVNSEQESAGMTEKEKLEANKRKLELELALTNDELAKLEGDGGEVETPEKPAGEEETQAETPETTEDETTEDVPTDNGQEDLAERVKTLEAQLQEKDKEIAALEAKIGEFVDAQVEYFEAHIPANAEGAE